MMNDPLASVLSNILNGEHSKKQTVRFKPVSNTTKKVLETMQKMQYIGDVAVEDDGRGGTFIITLLGSINKCGAIKPRHAVGTHNFEKFEKRYLPAKDFGVLIVSTSDGVMTHLEAKQKGIGGKLLAYCY